MKNVQVTLRNATKLDLTLLQYWDTKQHVIDCDPDSDWNWETELQKNPFWRKQLIAEAGTEPVGFVQIIDPYHEETHYWGTVPKNKRAIDIWIGEEKNLGKGLGTKMMQQALALCFENPAVSGVLIDPLKSNKKAHRFYEKLGFTFLQERTFDGEACFVYEFKRLS